MSERRKAPWCEDKVDECEYRPNGDEYEEVDLGRRVGMPVSRPPMRDWVTVRMDIHIASVHGSTHHMHPGRGSIR